jgi:hypothetical protein
MMRMHGRRAGFLEVFRIVVDHELQRIEHADRTRRLVVEVVAQRAFEHAHVDPRVDLRHADPLAEQLDALRREAAAANPDDGRHARVVPAVDVAFGHQLQQLALAGDRVGEVQAREFDLLRQRPREHAGFGELVEHPVVQRTVILEFERAQRMRDAFERIRDAVRVVVHRIHAPCVAGAIVVRVADAVDHRVAHVHVRRRHVDLRAQHVLAVLELAGLHPAEQVEVFLGRTVAIRRRLAAFGQRAAVRAHFVRALAVDVRLAALDQQLGELVELVVVVAREILMIDRVLAPVEAEPAHRVDDRVDVFDAFLFRVRVVEAQVAHAAVVACDAEVQADALRVADVQIAVRLGREARLDAAAPFAGAVVVVDDVADEIGSRGGVVTFGAHAVGVRLCRRVAPV